MRPFGRAHRFAFASLAAIRGVAARARGGSPAPLPLAPRSLRPLTRASVAPSAALRASLRFGSAVALPTVGGFFIGCRGQGLALRLGALIAPPRLLVAAWLPLRSCRARFALPLDALDTPCASPVSPPASVAFSLRSSAPLFPALPAHALFARSGRRSLKKTADTAGCP